MAVAETIKPSSSRKHLAASFRLVREDRRGLLARQQCQHACLSECAIAQSIALRCQITLEWTAATRTSTPSVCHDATIRVSHSVWNTDPETRSGEGEQRQTAGRRQSRCCCLTWQIAATRSFYALTHPAQAAIKCITALLRDRPPRPPATAH